MQCSESEDDEASDAVPYKSSAISGRVVKSKQIELTDDKLP
jgi:hypothetical protein